jgi:hypothetical protein
MPMNRGRDRAKQPRTGESWVTGQLRQKEPRRKSSGEKRRAGIVRGARGSAWHWVLGQAGQADHSAASELSWP